MRNSEQSIFAHNVWSILIERFYLYFLQDKRSRKEELILVLSRKSPTWHLLPIQVLNIHPFSQQHKDSKGALQIKVRILTSNSYGLGKEKQGGKEQKLFLVEKFYNRKGENIAIPEFWEIKIFQRGGKNIVRWYQWKLLWRKESEYRINCIEELGKGKGCKKTHSKNLLVSSKSWKFFHWYSWITDDENREQQLYTKVYEGNAALLLETQGLLCELEWNRL